MSPLFFVICVVLFTLTAICRWYANTLAQAAKDEENPEAVRLLEMRAVGQAGFASGLVVGALLTLAGLIIQTVSSWF